MTPNRRLKDALNIVRMSRRPQCALGPGAEADDAVFSAASDLYDTIKRQDAARRARTGNSRD